LSIIDIAIETSPATIPAEKENKTDLRGPSGT
jgi:hypothetical protein